jgi:(p)ppGpp synthase/HD superfamily hydrolase
VAKAISDENADIVNADVRSQGTHSVGTFSIQVRNLKQLDGVIKSIVGVKGVHMVARKGEVTGG